VLRPRWVPDSADARDFELLSKEAVEAWQHHHDGQHPQQQHQQQQEGGGSRGTAAGLRRGAGEPAAGDAGDAGEPYEVELEAGGVLGEVFEEALDVIESLWQAAE
jgi:hypothetical protein